MVTAYFSLTAAIFIGSGMALILHDVESEVLLSALLAISGAAAVAILSRSRTWRPPSSRSHPGRAQVALWWVALAMTSLYVSVVVNQLSLAALVLLVGSALAEEVAFRRLPAECQLRAGLSGRGPTLVFAGVTTLVFVVSHGTAPVMPTIEKVVFGVCAYLVCLWTRSLFLPSALHLLGNASASVWVVDSGSTAGDWFSVGSVFLSLLALSCASGLGDPLRLSADLGRAM